MRQNWLAPSTCGHCLAQTHWRKKRHRHIFNLSAEPPQVYRLQLFSADQVISSTLLNEQNFTSIGRLVFGGRWVPENRMLSQRSEVVQELFIVLNAVALARGLGIMPVVLYPLTTRSAFQMFV